MDESVAIETVGAVLTGLALALDRYAAAEVKDGVIGWSEHDVVRQGSVARRRKASVAGELLIQAKRAVADYNTRVLLARPRLRLLATRCGRRARAHGICRYAVNRKRHVPRAHIIANAPVQPF